MCIRDRCDVVILSAFGCGAFGNPPNVVARLFRNKLELLRMSSLRQAVFCIFDDHNAHRRHNPEGNVQPFLQEFGLAALGWPESGPGPGPGSLSSSVADSWHGALVGKEKDDRFIGIVLIAMFLIVQE